MSVLYPSYYPCPYLGTYYTIQSTLYCLAHLGHTTMRMTDLSGERYNP